MTESVALQINIVEKATDEVVAALNRLLPQLSATAATLDAEAVQKLAEAEATTLLVARIEDQIVGMLSLITFRAPSGVRARIEDVVVDGEVRGRGVGAALTGFAIDLARGGARTLDLTSRASREVANRMYEQLGFVERDSRTYRFAGEF